MLPVLPTALIVKEENKYGIIVPINNPIRTIGFNRFNSSVPPLRVILSL